MKLRVGVVGNGGIATKFHLPNLLKMNDVEVVANCDIIEERARQFAEKAGSSRTYTHYSDMFNNEKLDAVFICVPPYAHPDIELEAARRGIHVFIQKPMALSMEKALRVAETFDKYGIISSVGFQDRYLDIVDNIRDYIKDKKVGIMTASWMGGIPGVPWWRSKEQSGGQVVEQNIHLFDQARFLFGEVDKVYAACGRGLITDVEGYDVEDYSGVTITFKNGMVGLISTGCYLKGGSRNGMDIFTSEGRAEYTLRKSVRYYEPKNVIREVLVAADNKYISDRTFIEAVISGDSSKIRSPYSDALKSLELTLAVNQSMETGQPVSL